MGDQSSMMRFLAKLRELVWPKLTAEEQAEFNHLAAGHAGGSARADRLRAEREAADAEGAKATSEGEHTNGWPLVAGPFDLSEDGRTGRVQIFPRCGTYTHPRYGELVVTPEFLAEVKRNFEAKVYQQELPLTIDLEHQTSLSGAAGWISDIEVKGQDGADAIIEFNDRGQALVSADAYRYFSPEYYDSWQDPATGKVYKNVLVGGALTNRPFFKGMAPVVVASEGLYAFTELIAGRDVDRDVGGGVDRDKLPDSDFVDPEGRRFPIVTPGDVSDAVSSYGRAKPLIPMERFQARLKAICRRKGEAFMRVLPESWMAEHEASESESKSESTDEQPNINTGGEVMGMAEEEARRLTELETQHRTLTERLAAEEQARKAAEEQARQAVEKAAKLERASNRRALTEEVQAHRAGYVGQPEAVVDRLEALQAKLTAEEFEAYLAERRELANRLSESELLKQKSGAGVQVAGAQAEFDTLIKKVMSERGKGEPEAIAIVAQENPKLYGRLETEHNRRGRRGGD